MKMKIQKSAFTLIELLISIVILSILMLFLYKSYANLNRSNLVLKEQTDKIAKIEELKKTLNLDFTSALSVTILKQDPKKDIVFLQTKNSVHNRINPYVGYIFKDKMLYRIESLKALKEYPLVADSDFVADRLGKVKIFRVYKARDAKKNLYLVHILFEDDVEILLKVNLLGI